jgi:hypothetical protein
MLDSMPEFIYSSPNMREELNRAEYATRTVGAQLGYKGNGKKWEEAAEGDTSWPYTIIMLAARILLSPSPAGEYEVFWARDALKPSNFCSTSTSWGALSLPPLHGKPLYLGILDKLDYNRPCTYQRLQGLLSPIANRWAYDHFIMNIFNRVYSELYPA